MKISKLKFNKKICLFSLLVFVLIITALILIIKSGEKTPHPVIKIGYSAGAASSFPLYVAQEKGFFNQEGLKVQLENIEPNVIVPALLSKEIDYFAYTLTAVKASLKGAPIKTIIAFTNSTFLTLIAQPNLELKDLKNIGITLWFTPTHYLALRTIEENSLNAQIVAADSVAGASALLINKKVDALVHNIVVALQLREKGYKILKIFYDDYLAQGLTTSDEKIKNNHGEVKKVIKAVMASANFILSNPKETQELLFNYLGLEKNEKNQKMIEELYSVLKQGINKKGVPSEKEINALIKNAKVEKYQSLEDIEKQTVTPEDITKAFDFRFLK
jgi:ABC-type nitrate/sulfonate/bicarbonate transport system substrate-binding protein